MQSLVSKRARWILGGISILLCGLVFSIFIGHRYLSAPPVQLLSAIDEKASMTIRNLRQIATRNGVEEWQLDARSATLSDSGKTAELEGPAVSFYLRDDRRLSLTAKQGYLQLNDNDFEVIGDVVIRENRYELRTEKLQYQHKSRIITAVTPVEISSGWMHFKADGMLVDVNANQIVLKGNVEGLLGVGQHE
ncbi:MAG: LPS export ABC transporter periplasmic protein LptC [Thermodesulfobacteriota bacterium]